MEKNTWELNVPHFFDENLQLVHEWRNVKVKGHVEDVLDFIISN